MLLVMKSEVVVQTVCSAAEAQRSKGWNEKHRMTPLVSDSQFQEGVSQLARS